MPLSSVSSALLASFFHVLRELERGVGKVTSREELERELLRRTGIEPGG